MPEKAQAPGFFPARQNGNVREALREKASQKTIFSVLSSRKTLVCMKKTTLRMLLAVMGVAVIIYGLISGRLAESFHQTPYSTGFIVVILLIYAVVNFWNFFKGNR